MAYGLRMGMGRDALEGNGPRRARQERFDRRLGEVATVVVGGYCTLQTIEAGHRLGVPEGGGTSLPSNSSLRMGWGWGWT